MSSLESAPDLDGATGEHGTPTGLAVAPDAVMVRRNAGLAALVGALASTVAIAYLARATATGAVLDWVLAGALGLLGVGHLAALVDARTPLLVADGQGVRIRLGRTWRGLPWGALHRVEHTPRRGAFRDGRLVMVVRNPARLLEELEPGARRQSRVSQALYGGPFALPLGLSTKVVGAGDDLTAALSALAGDRSAVVELAPHAEPEDTPVEPVETSGHTEVEPVETSRPADSSGFRDASLGPERARDRADAPQSPRPFRPLRRLRDRGSESPRRFASLRRLRAAGSDPRPAVAHALFRVSGLFQRDRADAEPDLEVEPEIEASETPSPMREPSPASRVEVRREAEEPDGPTEEPSGRELRRPGSVSLVEDTVAWGDRISPIARPGNSVEPLLIDDYAAEPADDPVIGPDLSAARTRLGLTVDQLADRTRIRPHVIESIEVDDFAPCGGDFYARGHLRTLARVLGVDVAPLLTAYDERYADAPINPRRVFEAELATGGNGPIRGTRGGPNWSVLVAAVMALVLAWSVARLVMDAPVELRGAAPVLNGSAGVDNGRHPAAPAVPVVLTAEGGGARVVVRDGTGVVVFNDNLAFGESTTLQVSPPVRVQTTDGSLTVTVDGQERGPLGSTGEPAQNTFTVD